MFLGFPIQPGLFLATLSFRALTNTTTHKGKFIFRFFIFIRARTKAVRLGSVSFNKLSMVVMVAAVSIKIMILCFK